MVRTVFWFVYFWVYQIISLFFLSYYFLLGKLGKKEKQQQYLHRVTSRWARSMFWAAGATVEVKGLENLPKNQNILLVSNHQGNFDIPLLLGYIPLSLGFVAKVELSKMPVVSTWMKLLGCIFLDRKNPRQSIQAISTGVEYLKKGKSLAIFPEGTRSKGLEMGEFKKGSLKLGVKSNVLIVPVSINGTYKLLEENRYKITPSKVQLYIHPPVNPADLTKEEQNDLAEIIQKKIHQQLIVS